MAALKASNTQIAAPLELTMAGAQASPLGGAAKTSPLGGAVKRIVDVLLASLILVAIAPIMLIVAGIVWTTDPGPVIFRHTRLGFGGRTFGCLKFRTMVTNSAEVLDRLLKSDPSAAEEWNASQKLKNDPRITPIGAVLRKLSVDELPQLINVIRGEMSLVGPRPIVAAEVERYGSRFMCYQVARPGITGLWQVGGRSDCTYGERIAYDTHYANNWSLANDFVILVRTVGAVMRSRGSC